MAESEIDVNGSKEPRPFFNVNDPMAGPLQRDVKAEEDAIKSKMSPPGALNLPSLLEERRWQFLITDGAFKKQAVYDRIYIHQLSESEGETYGDTQIIMPDVGRIREREEAPRGVLVSAGLRALDHIRSNGMDLGHIIAFVKNAPHRIPCETVRGKKRYVLEMNAGDIVGSEDLAVALRRRQCHIKTFDVKDEATGTVQQQHLFVDQNQRTWNPSMPFIPEDY